MKTGSSAGFTMKWCLPAKNSSPGGNRKVICPEKNEIKERRKKKRKVLKTAKTGDHHLFNGQNQWGACAYSEAETVFAYGYVHLLYALIVCSRRRRMIGVCFICSKMIMRNHFTIIPIDNKYMDGSLRLIFESFYKNYMRWLILSSIIKLLFLSCLKCQNVIVIYDYIYNNFITINLKCTPCEKENHSNSTLL